jgi:hypothetical protein
MLYRTLLLLLLLTTFSCVAHAQFPRDPFPDRVSPAQMEMRARMEIKASEKDREESLGRAREAAQLGAELRDAYVRTKSLDHAGVKKLERLEKLARRIRNDAGGSDTDSTLENPPHQLESALSRLAEVSEAVHKGVEKTPRQVISASVIERANELLDLVSYVRTMIH